MTEEELREKIGEMILGVRQYLCNTEFAEEPFTEDVDPNILKVTFPSRIIALFKESGWEQRPEPASPGQPSGEKGG